MHCVLTHIIHMTFSNQWIHKIFRHSLRRIAEFLGFEEDQGRIECAYQHSTGKVKKVENYRGRVKHEKIIEGKPSEKLPILRHWPTRWVCVGFKS